MGDQGASPASLRDAFYRLVGTTAPAYEVVLAEQAEPLTADAGYTDLFSFESDMAQLVGTILLFAESPGSLAELGAFAALESVAPSLLAVVTDFHYDQVSFIRNGPLRFLEQEIAEESVVVLERALVGIDENGSIADLNLPAFSEAIFPAVENRLSSKPRWSKFDPQKSGHAILLLTGLCQEFGALTVSEIRAHLKHFGVAEPRMTNFLYCAQSLGWLRRVRKGHHIYYVGVPADRAVDYHADATADGRDKVRWRADIREYWQKFDAPRFRAITEVIALHGGAS